MNKVRVVFLSLLLALTAPVTANQTTDTSVNVNVNDRVYSFEQPIRVSVLLSVVANQKNWHWPASAIYKLGIPKALGSEAEIKSRLANFAKNIATGDKTSDDIIQAIISNVMGWHIADRLAIALDYDRIRLLKHENPLLTPGSYLLRLREYPKNITILGAIDNSGPLAYQANMTAADAIRSAGFTDLTHPDFAYVIHPNGEIDLRGIAYWNIDTTPIAPGSIVVALIKERVIGGVEQEFNKFLVELARNRVLP